MVLTLILFLLLQVADIYTTYKGLTSGKAKEANPVMKFLMGKVGLLPALLLSKIFISAGMSYAYVFYGATVTVIPNLVYVYVIYNNIRTLKTTKVI